jgi:hypothetical protein
MNIESEILRIASEVSGDKNMNLETKLLGVQTQIDSLSIIEILVKIQNFAKDNNLVFEWTMDNLLIDGHEPFHCLADLLISLKAQNSQ